MIVESPCSKRQRSAIISSLETGCRVKLGELNGRSLIIEFWVRQDFRGVGEKLCFVLGDKVWDGPGFALLEEPKSDKRRCMHWFQSVNEFHFRLLCFTNWHAQGQCWMLFFFVALCSPIVLRLSDVDDDDSCGGLAYCFFFLLVCKKLLFYVEVFSSLCVVVVAGVVIIMLKLWKLHDCGANGWVFGSWKWRLVMDLMWWFGMASRR